MKKITKRFWPIHFFALLILTGVAEKSHAQGFGIGVGAPTGILHLQAGTAAANTAPLKFNSGVNLTTPEAGAMEFDGTRLYFTNSTPTRRVLLQHNLGLAGGTTLVGGTAASQNLTFSTTSNATKGSILFGTSAYVESSNRLGIGLTNPNTDFHVNGFGTFGNAFAPVAGNGANIINILAGSSAAGASNGISFWESSTPFGMKLGYDGVGAGATNALRIYNDTDASIFTFENGGEFGIGTNTPATPFHVVINTGALPGTNHSVTIENLNAEAELRLDPGGTGAAYNISADDGATNGLRIFQAGTNVFQIQMDGSPDLQTLIRPDASAQNDDGWTTAAVDYGEFMEKHDYNEAISIFEVVGIKNGKITKNTSDASVIMVTSTDAGIRGGNPICEEGDCSRDKNPNWLAVAFIGQMPITVEGEVNEGDYIIPSGKHDGKAIAVSSEKITLDQFNSVIGVATESSVAPSYEQLKYDENSDDEFTRELARLQLVKGKHHIINTIVNVNFGLPQHLVKAYALQITALEKQLRDVVKEYKTHQDATQAQLTALESKLNSFIESNSTLTSRK